MLSCRNFSSKSLKVYWSDRYDMLTNVVGTFNSYIFIPVCMSTSWNNCSWHTWNGYSFPTVWWTSNCRPARGYVSIEHTLPPNYWQQEKAKVNTFIFCDNFFYTSYQDKNTSALIMLLASNRWLGFRGDVISIVLVTSVSVGAMLATQSPGEYQWTNLFNKVFFVSAFLSLCFKRLYLWL